MPRRKIDWPNIDGAHQMASLLARIDRVVAQIAAGGERIDELLAQVKALHARIVELPSSAGRRRRRTIPRCRLRAGGRRTPSRRRPSRNARARRHARAGREARRDASTPSAVRAAPYPAKPRQELAKEYDHRHSADQADRSRSSGNYASRAEGSEGSRPRSSSSFLRE
jgi:hypothetical protein